MFFYPCNKLGAIFTIKNLKKKFLIYKILNLI